MPVASLIRWCLPPVLPRSTGLRPVLAPPFNARRLQHPEVGAIDGCREKIEGIRTAEFGEESPFPWLQLCHRTPSTRGRQSPKHPPSSKGIIAVGRARVGHCRSVGLPRHPRPKHRRTGAAHRLRIPTADQYGYRSPRTAFYSQEQDIRLPAPEPVTAHRGLAGAASPTTRLQPSALQCTREALPHSPRAPEGTSREEPAEGEPRPLHASRPPPHRPRAAAAGHCQACYRSRYLSAIHDKPGAEVVPGREP
ncbi:hypothetical protein SALBM135S_05398 [Streptomyces alboniger]